MCEVFRPNHRKTQHRHNYVCIFSCCIAHCAILSISIACGALSVPSNGDKCQRCSGRIIACTRHIYHFCYILTKLYASKCFIRSFERCVEENGVCVCAETMHIRSWPADEFRCSCIAFHTFSRITWAATHFIYKQLVIGPASHSIQFS